MIKQIIPANDWFFVAPNHDDKGKAVWVLAAWALHDDGTVTGMVSIEHPCLVATSAQGACVTARLVEVPSPGMYRNLRELSPEELGSISSGGLCHEPPAPGESWALSH